MDRSRIRRLVLFSHDRSQSTAFLNFSHSLPPSRWYFFLFLRSKNEGARGASHGPRFPSTSKQRPAAIG